MDFSKVVEFIKLKPRHVLPIVIATGVVLLSPDSWLLKLGLQEIRTKWQLWIGIAFLGSFAILGSHLVLGCVGFVNTRLTWRRNRRTLEKYLHRLSPEERDLLPRYMSEQTKTQYLPYNDGVVGGLVAAKVIWQASNLSSYFTNFAYNIQPWAWE